MHVCIYLIMPVSVDYSKYLLSQWLTCFMLAITIVKIKVVTSSQRERRRPHIHDVVTLPRSDWPWRWLRVQLSHWPRRHL